ncbi:DUF4112 domain-containing protein [Alteromonas sp. C1M14]|uniref:DUF4112 domain-containing protein n=1 Tax=Alteromonas sp. C1M14 TaxID=2841567 RepID=UPI001C08673F|nr:DUF4112 domain-containing protein [Alteromonas sp. C1M14]MBU2980142.1 DUF4112 domain-containing protein [Alteromonas sp. C1M14]
MSKNTEVRAPAPLLKAQKWANVLDTAVKLPVIPFRIGLDSIVGLLPGLGDGLMLLAGLRIVMLGKSLGMPKALVSAMVRNALLDFAIGFIPVFGDIADFFFKSNQKNVRIMEKWWISNNKGAVDKHTAEKLQQWREKLSD